MATKPAYRLTPPKILEHAIQKQIADVLKLEIAPAGKVSRYGVVWWAVDHANYAGEVPGIRISRGIIAGLSDLFFLHVGRAHFIELKEPTAGELSEPQKSVLAALFAASGSIGVATSPEEVLRLLDAWAIPRNRRVAFAA